MEPRRYSHLKIHFGFGFRIYVRSGPIGFGFHFISDLFNPNSAIRIPQSNIMTYRKKLIKLVSESLRVISIARL